MHGPGLISQTQPCSVPGSDLGDIGVGLRPGVSFLSSWTLGADSWIPLPFMPGHGTQD